MKSPNFFVSSRASITMFDLSLLDISLAGKDFTFYNFTF
jgi:hypothetical protein